ncbi:hypothetical protein [Pseudomonas aeruginosa]|uniref:hypothetical protein n=1 Tax=Pseudomonas aeruginosa TaxID=287 RepID=UPI004047CE55
MAFGPIARRRAGANYARQQIDGLQRDQGRSLFDVGGHNGLAQLVAELEGLGGGADEADLAAQVAAVAAELEQPRLAAVPAALELDGGQVVPVIEPGGDQKQCVEIGGVLERMTVDQVPQLFVLIGTEVHGEQFEQRRDRQPFVVRHRNTELRGQVFQAIEHVRPLRIGGLGDLGDVGLPVAGVALVQREGAEQRLDDGRHTVEHENAGGFVVVVGHEGSFR